MTMLCDPVPPLQGRKPGARPTIVFHIGLPKTGSTSIQHALVALADDLHERGIRVPYDRALYGSEFPNSKAPKGAPQLDGFSYFFNVRNRRPDSAVDWDDTVAQFLSDKKAATMVVSHESMSQSGSKLREPLMSTLAGQVDFRFVVYLREPLSHLNSYCLQLLQGMALPSPRASIPPVRRYLGTGYTGLLAPFESYGTVDARNFDVLRQEDRLVPDFFDAIGASDLVGRISNLERQNTKRPRFNLTCLFMALKLVNTPTEQEWIAIRGILQPIGEALEEPMQTGFLSAPVVADITARRDQESDEIYAHYGVRFDTSHDFKPGPDRLSFSREYGDQLQAAAKSGMSQAQRDWLARALALADQDLEAPGLQSKSKSGRVKARNVKQKTQPSQSIKGENTMSDETKAKVAVDKDDTMALARAIFRARNAKGGAEGSEEGSEEGSADKAAFKDVRDEMLPLARRTLRVLQKQGYGLTKS